MMTNTVCDGQGFHDFKKESSTRAFPSSFSRYVQSFGDVYFWKKGNFHVITRAKDAREVLTSADFSADRGRFFVSRMPNMDLGLIQDFFGVVKKMMVMSDDDDHARRRKAASTGFEDHILERFKETMTETIRKIVSDVEKKERFDFVQALSRELPATVLADLFSIPAEDRAQFLQWSNCMTGFFGGASQYRNEDGIEVNEAARSLKTYFQNLVELRRNSPGRDYVSLVLSTQGEFKLSDEEVISQLIMMLVAGMATTTDQMNNCMFLLSTNPEIQEEVRRDLALVPQMLEELKRFDPAVTFIFRLARRDTKIREQVIKEGDVIFISTHAINRDLPEEERPHEINIHRKGNHFAYGVGPHFCIGARLARMEMIALFQEVLQKLPPFVLDEERPSVRDHYSLSFSGFKELNLRWA